MAAGGCRGARAVDWEDIAIGPGPKRGRWYLYIGDIGDNERRRGEVVVYRVEEPRTAACKAESSTGRATAIRLRYPDEPHNARLLVHPVTGDLYLISKAGNGDPGSVACGYSGAAGRGRYSNRAVQCAVVSFRVGGGRTLALSQSLLRGLADVGFGGLKCPRALHHLEKVVCSRLYEWSVMLLGSLY